MSKYTVIADVGNKLVKLLQEHMVPDMVQNREDIGLCSPSDKGDVTIGICLYDIQESNEIRFSGMQNSSVRRQTYPPVCLNLFYMITAYSQGDIKVRATQENRILGRIIQVLSDYSVFPSGTLGQGLGNMDAKIEMLNLELDDKFKIWNASSVPYKTSIFYKIAPVELESEKSKDVQRVSEITFQIEE